MINTTVKLKIMNIQTEKNIKLIKKHLLKGNLTTKQLSKKTKIPVSSIYRVLIKCEKLKIVKVTINNKLNKKKVPTKIYSLIN